MIGFALICTASLLWMLIYFWGIALPLWLIYVFLVPAIGYSLWRGAALRKHQVIHTVTIVMLLNTIVGVQILTKWGIGNKFISAPVLMRMGMTALFLLSGYFIFVGYNAVGSFSRKRNNIERESLIEIELTWQERWQSLVAKFKKAAHIEDPNAAMEGVIFEIGEVVKEKGY